MELCTFWHKVEEVKTRALSLRTQLSRLIKPKPSGSGNKPLTPRQMWLLRVMDFIIKHIVHRPCKTTLDLSPSDQDNTEDPDYDLDYSTDSLNKLQTLQSRPNRPKPTSHTSSPVEFLDSPSTSIRNEGVESSTRGIKRKARAVCDVELQKLAVLKEMAAKVEVDPTPDAFTTFGNQVVAELRLLQDTAIVTRVKRNIMNMIYDAQDSERNGSSSSHSQSVPYTFQPIVTPFPPVQSYTQHMPPLGSQPQSSLQTFSTYDVSVTP